MRKGQTLKVLSESGGVQFFRITNVYGSTYFAKAIRQSEAGKDATVIRAHAGRYGSRQ